MDAAKNAVKGFMSKSGHHDTSVHETTAPAVTNETVNQHRHENVTTAVDREVHQDHYHTTVQPVHDIKQLPEQHHHNMAPVEHRKFEHGNDADVKRRLEAERAQFKDTTVKGDTKHTSSVAPTVAGEHIHHHVHENIQPVVDRQTIEPHVVHTTVPIHETHHSAAQHHSTSTLPAVHMSDFKKQGGSLTGSQPRSDFFEGEPRSMHGHVPHSGASSDKFRQTGHVNQHPHSTGAGVAGTGAAGAGAAALAGHRHRRGSASSSSSSSDEEGKSSRRTRGTGAGLTGAAAGLTGNHGTTGTHNTGSGLTGNHNTTGTSGLTGNHNTTGTSGLTGTHGGTDGPISTNHSRVDSTGVGHDTTTKKPSLLDRINPMKDTDGDGKKGIMD
ncbi:hypothetical protein B9Z65_7343 [Elsinoe australis]|uniref:Allergen n=1 Tax=Elsinoe australis TaxID=40998 RepID=A0A2P7YBW9_9PEZI|nr:hypothetical protein B9Z65_7343 [Elsinoe australis]